MKQRILLVLLFALSVNMALNAQVSLTATSGTLTGSFTTLKGAFDAINAGTHKGKIIITLSGNTTETSSAILYGSGTSSSSYDSIRIYPTATGVTISGTPSPLIYLYGADHVTIDGRLNAAGFITDMTISNTNSSGVTVQYYDDATYNTIKYCKLQGSSTSYGILYFSNTTKSSGNSYNKIDHNEISCSGSNRPYAGVYASGGTSYNTRDTISNNNFYNILKGVDENGGYISIFSFNTAWAIIGNSFYETTTTNPSGGQNLNLIYINTSGVNFAISNNYIGGNAPLCGGTWTKSAGHNTWYFMQIRVGTGTYSNIQGNTIKNINFTNSSSENCYGIDIYAGDVNIGTAAGNCIGASSGTGSIVFTSNGSTPRFDAIHVQDPGHVYIENNIIGSITTANSNSASATNFYGIYLQSDYGTYSVSNNTIGSTTSSNSINATSSSTSDAQQVYGVIIDGNGGTMAINNNTIANLKNETTNTTAGTYGSICGIYVYRCTNTITGNTIHDLNIANANTGSGHDWGNITTNAISAAGIAFTTDANATQTITGNKIYNISNTYSSFVGYVAGIYYYGQSTLSNISGNIIYGLSVSSSNSATIDGIKTKGGGAAYSNNIVTLGGNTTTNIYGIYDDGTGTRNIYFNSVYLNGSPTTGSSNSSGIYCANSGSRDYRSNIFFNARSNNGATGKHYCIYISGIPTTIDYNDYLATGNNGFLGYYGGDKSTLADWKIATSQDGHSLNLDPSFASAGGTSANNYIPTQALTAATTTGVTTDYGGTTRSLTSPEMGAWEQGNTVTWNSTSSNSWNIAANWNPQVVPTASHNIVVPDGTTDLEVNQSIATPAMCNNLIIQSGAKVVILPGKALTVNGTLTNSGGSPRLVIQSDETGTGSLIQSSASVGATVQRYISGSATLTANMYHMVSIPVNYTTPTSNLFLGSYLYKLDAAQVDPTNNNYYGLWVNMGTSTTNPLSCNSGYMIYYPATEHTYTFSGTLNTGSFSPNVSYGTTYTFNLVPNPYPSAINWGSSSGWIKSNIGATAWIWKASSGNYTTLSGPSYVPVGQAFIVMASGTPVLTMNNNACVHDATAFYKSGEANTLKISAQSNNYKDEAFVGFNSSASSSFDPQYDGFKLWGLEDAPQLWTEKGESRLSINQLPPPSGGLVVPVDFKTSYAGQVSLHFSGVESFDPSLAIRLQDLVNGSWTDLRQNGTYVFTHDTSNTEKRFSLVFGYPSGINTNTTSNGKAFISNGRICLDIPSMQGHLAVITVYDMLGQVIRSQEKIMDGIVSIAAELSKGVYIVRATSADQNFSTKVINK